MSRRSPLHAAALLLLRPALAAQEAPVPAARAPAELPELVVTATTRAEDPMDLPYSVDVIGAERLRGGARTLPDALERLPSVMVQRTAYGQASPFLRGLTGFHTLMLVDGVRLNHAAMREGPNQYWGTVDSLTVERLELVRGPSSVLYGSDAVGGTVNAVARRASRGPEGGGLAVGGGIFSRFASAEDSWIGRGEVEMGSGADWGLLGGISLKDFNDLQAGRDTGTLPYTGYQERDGDLRWDAYLQSGLELTLAAQTVRQIDVPRTHTTIFSVPYAGTTPGTELRRELDQVRDLVFGRVRWDDAGGLFHGGEVTVSVQRHDEERDRRRTGRRRDLSGFSLTDLGLTARFQSDAGDYGMFSWGVEAHNETANSFRRNYVAGSLSSVEPQGPIGDDASYATLAAYVQDELDLDGFRLIPGLRATTISAEADRVANPRPSGPPVIQVDDEWGAVVGSLRGLYRWSEEASLYAGLSQGFRAPSLADLTTFEATSAVEFPTPGLDPESFLQAELGTKGTAGALDWQVALWRTWIRDMIVQSPTGAFLGGVPVVEKDNVGDGWIHGAEADVRWRWARDWSSSATASLQDGEVEQVLLPQGRLVDRPASRLLPATVTVATRWQPPAARQWVEAWVWAADDQDRLALRDEADTTRIPPGGTPGYTVAGITAGWDVRDGLRLALSIENLGDKDYRVHGSGLNAPGRNVILTAEMRF